MTSNQPPVRRLLTLACATALNPAAGFANVSYSVPLTITATTPVPSQSAQSTQVDPVGAQQRSADSGVLKNAAASASEQNRHVVKQSLPTTVQPKDRKSTQAMTTAPPLRVSTPLSTVMQKSSASAKDAPVVVPASQASGQAITQQAGNDAISETPETAVELPLGGQKLVPLTEVPVRVALADPDIAEVTVLKPVSKSGKGAAILVVAKLAGTTSLLVWPRNAERPVSYSLTVNNPPLLPLAELPGVSVQTKGNSVRLNGTVRDVATYQAARDKIAKATISGKPVELTDNTTLTTSGTVQVDVKVVEFSRNDIQRLGIRFSRNNGGFDFAFRIPEAGGMNARSLAANTADALRITTGRNDSGGLLSQLEALQSEGVARVLAEPTLVAQSGQSASFLAGGEIPIPVPSGAAGVSTFSIQFKEFGIRLAFTPTILSSKTIALKVAPEVSDLDRTNGVTVNNLTVPAILTRRAETTVELGDGESFVIGGLISSNVTSNVDKLPILADLPIIGGFFRSVVYEKQDKELLIIATPRLVKPRARNAANLPLPGGPAIAKRPGWGQMFLPSGDGSLPGFSR